MTDDGWDPTERETVVWEDEADDVDEEQSESATDGGQHEVPGLDPDDHREVGGPQARLREAIKQICIAREDVHFDDAAAPALDEAEILLRGAADRLEWQGFPDDLDHDRELSPTEIVNGAEDDDVQEAIDEAAGEA